MKEDVKGFCVNENCDDYLEMVVINDYKQGDCNQCESCGVKLKIKPMEYAETNNLSIEDVKRILSNINFAEHSCIDMGWDFDVDVDQTMFLIRTSFMRKDIDNGEFGKGWGRWHTTPLEGATEKSIVMTAWVCIKMIVEHELLEGFEYHGQKIFDPHKSLDALVYPNVLPENR